MTLAMGVVAIDIVLLKMVLRCPNISQCCTFSTLATIPRITATMKGAVTMRLASGKKATSRLVCLVMSAGTSPKFMSIHATSKVMMFTACSAPTSAMYNGKATLPPSQVISKKGAKRAYRPLTGPAMRFPIR